MVTKKASNIYSTETQGRAVLTFSKLLCILLVLDTEDILWLHQEYYFLSTSHKIDS